MVGYNKGFGRLAIYYQETGKKIVNGFRYLRGALFLIEINSVTRSCLISSLKISHRYSGKILFN